MAEPDRPSNETPRAWRFVPRSDASASRDDLARFRGRLEMAVRAGHGLGASPTLVVRSGRECDVRLEAKDLRTSRWVERILASTYEPGQWRPVPWEPEAESRRRAVAGRYRLPGESPAVRAEGGDVLGTLAMSFSALGPWFELRCPLVPAQSSVPGWWAHRSVAAAPNGADRVAPRPPFGGAGAPRPAAEPGSELIWSASLVLATTRSVPEEIWRDGLRVVESAWRPLDGAGVRFSPLRSRLRFAHRFWVGSREIVALLPGTDLPGVATGEPPSTAATLGVGRTRSGGIVSVPVEPDQGRHLAVLGETGMGKSSLLVALAVRAARLGGLVLLDPLGETAAAVAEELGRDTERLLWIAPGEAAPGINALEGIQTSRMRDAVRAERRTSDLVHALRRVRSGRYEDSAFWGPRLEEMLTRAVRAAAALPGATLADAHTLLSTSGFTRQRVPAGAEEVLAELAARIRQRPDDADGARRLLHEVAANPTLERMICSRAPTLSTRDLVAPRRIVLISGCASVVGESTARYLLAVYLALVWSELLAAEDPRKTFVLLDEAQWFAHESLGEMLRIARRRNVHVVIATQSIASLPPSVQEAVWTNVADLVAFRGSPEEARELGRAAPGVAADRLLALPRGEAVAMIGKGNAVHWIRSSRIPRRSPDGGAMTREVDRPTGSGRSVPEGAARTELGVPDPGAEGAPEQEFTRTEEVIAYLCDRAGSAPSDRPFRVALSELRTRAPNAPQIVREAGACLGRQGALLRTERTADGSSWWLDPKRLDGLRSASSHGDLRSAADPVRSGPTDVLPPCDERQGPPASGATALPKPS